MRAGDTLRDSGVHVVAQRMVCLLNEVAAGARPARLVTPLLTAHLRGSIRRARPDRGGIPRIRRLIITSHRDGVYEVVAVCSRANRVSALGLQLTCCDDGRWQVTDVAHPVLSDRRFPATRPGIPAGTAALLSNPPSAAAPR